MIEALDRLVDTRQKRYSCFSIITMVLGILFILPYLRLSYALVTLSNYQDVFLLLESQVVKQTYLSRFVVSCLSMAEMNFKEIIAMLIQHVRVWEVSSIVLWVIFLSQKQTKRMRVVVCSVLLVFFISVSACVIVGFQATTLMEAVHMLKFIGIILAVCGMMIILLCAYQLIFIHIPKYYDALHYEVEECVKE